MADSSARNASRTAQSPFREKTKEELLQILTEHRDYCMVVGQQNMELETKIVVLEEQVAKMKEEIVAYRRALGVRV